MKKQPTGIEVLGSNLFNDRDVFEKARRKLPTDVLTAVYRMRRERPDLDDTRLRNLIHGAFGFEPLIIGEVSSLRIELQTRDYLNEYNCWMWGYLHEAVVPYTGSDLFWRHAITDKFAFGFRGKVGPSTVRLRTLIDEKAFDRFEELVQKELSAARAWLAATESVQRLLAEQARGMIDQALDKAFMS